MSANDMKVSLPFSVCSCSAQDENYPATRLALHTADSKGWQSPRMPPEYVTWPLELGLAFTGEVHIQQIQLLAHECKIPKKIDVWIGEAASSDAPATSSGRYEICSFKRLGHITLQSNQQSNYRARELKTVDISAHAVYLKLLVHPCHPCPYNRYNQVGLIAISVLGSGAGPSPVVDQVPLREIRPPGLEAQVQRELQADEGQFDALTWEKLRQLAICKNKAVEDEDYEAAKLCKQRIAELKEHATRIKELEALKMQAVAAEDYDGARNLKREIDRLRNIDPPQPLLPVASPMPFRGQPPPEGPEAGNFASGNFAPHPSGGQMQFSGDFAAHPGAGGGSGLFGNGGAPPPQGPAFPLGAQSPQVVASAPEHMVGDTPVPSFQPPHLAPRFQSPVASAPPPPPAEPNNGYAPETLADVAEGGRRELSGEAAPDAAPGGAQSPVAVGRFTPGYDPMADPDPFNSKGASRVAFSTEVPKGAFASMGLGAGAGAGAVPNGGGPTEAYDTAGLPPWAQELFHSIQEFNAKGLQATPLAADETSKAAPLAAAFGEYCAMCLLGKEKGLREPCIKALAQRLQAGQELGVAAAHAGGVCCQYLTLKGCGLGDPNLAVYFSCLALLKTVLQVLPPEGLQSLLAPLMPALMAKAADNIQRMREQTQSVLLDMAHRSTQCFELVVHHLFDDEDARKSKQNANNPRRVIAKLGFTAQLVRTFSLKGSLGVDAIMTRKVVPALDSPNVDVRQAAILLAAEAQLRQPKAMKPHVENLKANAQTSIQEAAEHLRNNPPAPGRPVPDRASAPAPAPAPAPEPMHTVRTSPSPVQVLLRSKTQGYAVPNEHPVPDDPVEIDPEECQFCLRRFPGCSEEDMELHWAGDCPMLMECACGQVVEILQLPEHLQDGDCGRQDDVRRCDRCGDPLMAGTYEAHMQTGCAPPPGPGQQRCPLCHQNLPAGDEAWQAHLLEPPGCPANPRHWSGRPSDREG